MNLDDALKSALELAQTSLHKPHLGIIENLTTRANQLKLYAVYKYPTPTPLEFLRDASLDAVLFAVQDQLTRKPFPSLDQNPAVLESINLATYVKFLLSKRDGEVMVRGQPELISPNPTLDELEAFFREA
jgi:hypothetical protein